MRNYPWLSLIGIGAALLCFAFVIVATVSPIHKEDRNVPGKTTGHGRTSFTK
jgi:hypothetical protein